MSEIDVTPAPLSQAQLVEENARRELLGKPQLTCQICEMLLSWIVTGNRPVKDFSRPYKASDSHWGAHWVINLGTFEEALASRCPQHTAIVKHLQLREMDIRRRYEYDEQLDRGVVFVRYSDGVAIEGPHLNRGSVPYNLQLNLKLAYNFTPVGQPFRGVPIRVIDQEWVDLPLISRWIDSCSTSHDEECRNPMNIMRVVPELLVDVKRKCIVKGREGHRFMCLSYRLGNAAPFRLYLRDLEAYQREGVLEDAQILENLPLTVRHAILLARELGFDYLWTDVLCIVHDGPATLADQLDKMSAIYTSATLTIVATDGDGTDGIMGLRGISPPRGSPQAAFPIHDKHLIIPNNPDICVTNGSVAYHLRGWTYQEYIMSPRKLVFMNYEAYWVCQYTEQRESEARDLNDRNMPDYDPSLFIREGFPELGKLSELLSWYNIRDLTCPDDALPAIAGLLAVLSRGFEGGFLYGLPERFFDIALSWRPSYFLGDRKTEEACRLRREPLLDCKFDSTAPAASVMPSWSWTAWRGGFSFGRHEVAQFETRPTEMFCETTPITQWSTSNDRSGSNRRLILSNWHVDRKSIDDHETILHTGWTRTEISIAFPTLWEALRPPLFWRTIIYRHQTSDIDTFWHYPFPKPEINDSTAFKVPKQTRYLFCKTRKASVLLQGRRNLGKASSKSPERGLWASKLDRCREKLRIGRMWLHNP